MSTLGIPSLGRFELAARVVLDGATGSWFVVGLEDHEAASILGDELESIAEESVAMVPVSDGESLVAASHDHASGLAIFYTAVPLEELHLDVVRSNLQRERAAGLAGPPHQLTRIASIAPHFTSWAGNRVFLVEEDRFLDQKAIETRLNAIRTHYGMNDEEFLEMVQRRDLPLEPEHAEWLVLLGRSDLLGGGS